MGNQTSKVRLEDVTIICPTKSRPERVAALLQAVSHRPLLLVATCRKDLPEDLKGATWAEQIPNGAPKAVHHGINWAVTSHILVLNDDIDWPKINPDFVNAALETLNRAFPDGQGVVGLNDLHRGQEVACFALFAKKFYSDHLDWTVYDHYSGDLELTMKAKALGVFAFCEAAQLPHLYANGTGWGTPAAVKDQELLNTRMEAFQKERSKREGKRLFVALPVHEAIDPLFWQCTLKMVAKFSQNTSILPCIGDSLITRARNALSAAFLRTDCTHLLFIDSDVIFSTDHIDRLMSHDVDIVGGFYPIKNQDNLRLCCNTLDDNPPGEANGLHPMKYMGSGFLCIARRVFEKMIEVQGKSIAYRPDHNRQVVEYDFWRVGVYPGTDRYLSEDWYFCQVALDLGFKIWGDTFVALKHSGNTVYPLKSQEPYFFRRPETRPAPEAPCADAIDSLQPSHGEPLMTT